MPTRSGYRAYARYRIAVYFEDDVITGVGDDFLSAYLRK
jgi:hypothetical protein